MRLHPARAALPEAHSTNVTPLRIHQWAMSTACLSQLCTPQQVAGIEATTGFTASCHYPEGLGFAPCSTSKYSILLKTAWLQKHNTVDVKSLQTAGSEETSEFGSSELPQPVKPYNIRICCTRGQLYVAVEGKLEGQSVGTCEVLRQHLTALLVSCKRYRISMASACYSFAIAQTQNRKAEKYAKFKTHWCILSYFAAVNKLFIRSPP